MFGIERLSHLSRRSSTELVPILSGGNNNDVDLLQTRDSESLITTGDKAKKAWPWMYWFILKVLCLFHTRRIVCSRQCHKCRLERIHRDQQEDNAFPLSNYLFPSAIDTPAGWIFDDTDGFNKETARVMRDENANDTPEDQRDEDEACYVCQSMWWDAEGKIHVYTEENIGVAYWNHRYSGHLSIVLLTAIVSFVLYDALAYLKEYWGFEKELIRLISYLSYHITVYLTVPVLCLVANLRNIVPRSRVHHFAWTTSLHPRYIVKRLQYLRPETRGLINKPFLAACLLWPIFNSAYRAGIFICMVQTYDIHVHITLITNGVASLLWGCFCYLIIIFRHSFETQLDLDIIFLLKHIGKVDICRRRLASSLDEYGSVCSLSAKWMVLNVSMVSLALATHISWNYLQFTDKIIKNHHNKRLIHLNIMIWSEIIMILILPLVAVGGLDLRHIWNDFRIRICEVRCDQYHRFWSKIFKFITREFDPVTHVVELTLLFSVVTLYMALKMDDQNADYWNRHGVRNMTNVSTPGIHHV